MAKAQFTTYTYTCNHTSTTPLCPTSTRLIKLHKPCPTCHTATLQQRNTSKLLPPQYWALPGPSPLRQELQPEDLVDDDNDNNKKVEDENDEMDWEVLGLASPKPGSENDTFAVIDEEEEEESSLSDLERLEAELEQSGFNSSDEESSSSSSETSSEHDGIIVKKSDWQENSGVAVWDVDDEETFAEDMAWLKGERKDCPERKALYWGRIKL